MTTTFRARVVGEGVPIHGGRPVVLTPAPVTGPMIACGLVDLVDLVDLVEDSHQKIPPVPRRFAMRFAKRTRTVAMTPLSRPAAADKPQSPPAMPRK